MRRNGNRDLRRVLATSLVAPLLFASGCRQIMAVLGSLLGGGAGGGFNGAGTGGGGLGSLPGLLGGAGGPLSPSSSLPPPTQSAAQVQEILQRYGIQVTGSGATPENVDTLLQGMQHYNAEHFRGLRQFDIPSVPSHNLNGLWQSSGGSAKITLWAHTSRRKQVSRHTVTHEIGHHASLFSRGEVLGQPLSNALGNGENAFPRDYARTNWREKVADNLAFILLGPQSEMRPASSWRPTQQAMDLISGEFRRNGGTPPAQGTPPATGAVDPGSSSAPRPGLTS